MVMGNDSDVEGYDKRTLELSNAPIRMKQRHHQYTDINI